MIQGRWTALLLAAALGGCGGGGGAPTGPPVPTPSPTPAPVRTVLESKAFTDLPAGAATPSTVDNVAPGTVDAMVDWAGGGDIDLYVTDTNCTSMRDILAGSCRVLARATAMTAKPERASFPNPSTANYIFWVHNNGPAAESGQLEVGLTR